MLAVVTGSAKCLVTLDHGVGRPFDHAVTQCLPNIQIDRFGYVDAKDGFEQERELMFVHVVGDMGELFQGKRAFQHGGYFHVVHGASLVNEWDAQGDHLKAVKKYGTSALPSCRADVLLGV